LEAPEEIMAKLDLVIRGGKIVGAAETAITDVGIANGTIAQIGGDLRAAREIDATGKLLLPGGVDAHVHLSVPPGERAEPHWVDDFTSGSAAALAGGITTLGNMTFLADGELPLDGLEREGALARAQAIADVFLHPVLAHITPQALDQVAQLPGAGCNTIKIFMSSPRFDHQASGFVEAIRRAGAASMLTMIHCEDAALIEDATEQLVRQGRTALRHYPASRPDVAEVIATQRAVAIAEATGSPVYIVHLSSARALAVCADAQARGIPVYVETRPLYLHLTAERFLEQDGPKYLGQPPLREPRDVDALWHGLRQGTVHTVCTDHAPYSLAAKLDPTLSITRLRPGVENLQTLLPMLYSEGVRRGRLTLQRLVEVTASNAARLFGIYPRKGAIAVGSDADLVIFDPDRTRRVERAMLKSHCDYSPYEGWEVTGWPALTLRRGEIVFQDDQVTGVAGSGALLRRGPTGAL
jgi:dihydropyrimidinase